MPNAIHAEKASLPAVDRRGRLLRALIAGLLVVVVVADVAHRLGVTLLRDDLFVGDAAQHTWWMYRFADPSLYPGDLAARYMSLSIYSPPLYQAIFWLAGANVDAQRLAELLAIDLALLGAVLAWFVGRRIGGFAGGAAAVLVWVLGGSAQLVEGGFPRSFGLILLLAGMLAILARRWIAFGVVMVAVTLLYPPIVLNLAPVAGGVLLLEINRRRAIPRGFAGLCICGVVAVAIVAMLYLRPLPDDIGRWTTYEAAREMPEWGRHGRTQYFRPWRVFYFHSSTAGIGLTVVQAAVAVLALGVTLVAQWRGRQRIIRPEAWLLLVGALAMWALAHAFAFKLYLPSRYMTYSLPVFFMMWASGLAAGLVRQPRGGEPSRRWPVIQQIGLAAMILATGLFAARAVAGAVLAYQAPPLWNPPAGYDRAMEILRTYPVGTVIASHPMDANPIPLYTRRSVLVNDEVAIPFHDAYYAEMKRRLEACFEMLYASDWATIDAVADREGVSVFLLQTGRLTWPDAWTYRQPFEAQNQPAIARGRFAMLSPPADRVVMASGEVMLLRVGSRQ